MAYNSITTTFAPGLWAQTKARTAGVLSTMGRWLDSYVVARSRADQVQRLMDMTDDQLAARGLTRDRIVHHVFRDCFYM